MRNDIEINLRKVNSLLLTALSSYCQRCHYRVRSIENANDLKIVAELYNEDVLTMKLLAEGEVVIETQNYYSGESRFTRESLNALLRATNPSPEPATDA
ncbi:hypothetical protein J3369_15030 [Alteromonas sp. NFXS44]|uniref:hypothetical protein n=1 Tax=Alteromonas sp. NFXS44 TaxID=2818435 RepID=UPI0032E00FF7